MHKQKSILVSVALAATLLASGLAPAGAASPGPDRKIDPQLLSQAQAQPAATFDVIVQAQPQALPAAAARRSQQMADRVRAVGGTPRRALGLIGATSARITGRLLTALAAQPDVAYVSEDQPVRMHAAASDSASAFVLEDDTLAAWQTAGVDGTGVTVAVLDSGVAPHSDLAGRIVAAVDLTQGTAVVAPADAGGHGTHVAGIVAGNGAPTPATATSPAAPGRTGVAPGAKIVSLRVLDSQGHGSLSTVIAGIQWAVQHRRDYNIRVLNLSLGAHPSGSYQADPLAAMAEVAVRTGITVVAAAGNDGPAAGGASTIASPGYDPFVLAVGALDDNATLGTGDDVPAPFTSQGPTNDGVAKPDLAAYGRKIVSLRVPGSTLDQLYPDRVTDTNYFRLSGTSQAAPQVAGAAALLLQKNPGLSPAGVRDVLLRTTRPVPNASPTLIGVGALDIGAALANPTSRATFGKMRVADAFARMVYPLIKDTQPLVFVDPNYNGGVDSKGISWSNISWGNVSWDQITWGNVAWDNISWGNVAWDNISWDSATWDSSGDWDSSGQLSTLLD
jgi:serine protease AprX